MSARLFMMAAAAAWVSGAVFAGPSLAGATAQDPPEAGLGPTGVFIVCPGHPRCPRQRPAGANGTPGPDPGMAPSYGTVRLNGGFLPDPLVVALQAGGGVETSALAPGCGGLVAEAPDVSLMYSAGSLPLYISVDSSADTMLLVNAPDGSWHCDDDGGASGSNPSLRFEAPSSGRYDIWVGTSQRNMVAPARLHLSELYSQ